LGKWYLKHFLVPIVLLFNDFVESGVYRTSSQDNGPTICRLVVLLLKENGQKTKICTAPYMNEKLLWNCPQRVSKRRNFVLISKRYRKILSKRKKNFSEKLYFRGKFSKKAFLGEKSLGTSWRNVMHLFEISAKSRFFYTEIVYRLH